jgi:DNA-binding transcriptional ArsR family regulator
MTTELDREKLAALTPLDALHQAAECLKTLAHPHRLRMVQMLLRDRYTVGELAQACGIPSHMASEHLRLMQRCGFLTSEKEGRKAYYRIVEMHLAGIIAGIETRFVRRRPEAPAEAPRQ